MKLKLKVWGPLACFTRPEFKAERYSYDVMTPSAACGLLKAIYWHPDIEYAIESIQVCNPIEFSDSLKRNELSSKAHPKVIEKAMKTGTIPHIIASRDRQQRATTPLKNVCYIITASIELKNQDDTAMYNKTVAIFNRRAKKGQCHHTPYLGCREFEADFVLLDNEPIECPPELKGEKDLGSLLFGFDRTDEEHPQPLFFRAKLADGLMIVPNKNSEEVKRIGHIGTEQSV